MHKMDYLELAAKGCIILGGGMLIGVALYMTRAWWLEREKRRGQEAIEQMEDEHYAGLPRSLLSHIDEIRKVDRQ
jgi:hypothetical protein